MKRLNAWGAMAAIVLSGCGCGGGGGERDSAAKWLDLEIERPEVEIVEPEIPIVEELDGDELITNAYYTFPSFLKSAPGGGGSSSAAPDPFAAPDTEGPRKVLTAKEVLEAYGVVFGPGAWASELAAVQADQIAPKPAVPSDPFGEGPKTVIAPAERILESCGVDFPEGTRADYDKESQILTVVQLPDWMDLVETIMDRSHTREFVINVRAEIFEVPAALALRLEQSAGEHYDHGPELEALQKVVKAGDARFITSANLQSRSGQRSACEATEEIIYFAGFSWDKTVEPARVKPDFETRDVGTSLEIDAVAGPDRKTIDVYFSLEHHTAPPFWTSTAFPFPSADEPMVVEIPHFHVKTMISQISLLSGNTKLLGSWRPTGLPEFEESDVMRIVFLRADIQVLPIVGE